MFKILIWLNNANVKAFFKLKIFFTFFLQSIDARKVEMVTWK